MNHFIKVFIISLLSFSLVIFTGLFTYDKYFGNEGIEIGDSNDKQGNEEDDNIDYNSPLEKAMRDSHRINVLLLGLEGYRTDTIMLASFDRKTKDAIIISIPRDTYYKREGYSKYSEFQKVNAIFQTEDTVEDGYKAVAKAVEEMIGIPIEKYVSIEYDGVRAAVTAIGGVEVDVPFHMKYSDPYDTPPLYIDIPAGKQIIYGDKAMEFLRFRKSNHEGYYGYKNGDLGRIEVQQQFVKSAINKSLSLKLPSVISAVYPHVKTNFTLTELLGLGKDAIGFSIENLETTTIPGIDRNMGGLSFYVVDGEEVIKLVYDLYDVPLSAETDSEELANNIE